MKFHPTQLDFMKSPPPEYEVEIVLIYIVHQRGRPLSTSLSSLEVRFWSPLVEPPRRGPWAGWR